MAQSKILNAQMSLKQTPYWVLTLRTERQVDLLIQHCNKTDSVRFAFIGPWEVSAEGERHCHAFVQYDKSRRKHWAGFFAQELKNMWMSELEIYNGGTIFQAKLNYLCYCIKEGPPQYSKGIIPPSVKLHMVDENEVLKEEEVLCTQESDEEDEEIRRPKKRVIIEDSDSDNDLEIADIAFDLNKADAEAVKRGFKNHWEEMEAQTKIVKQAPKQIAPKTVGRPKGSGSNATAPKRTKTSDIIRNQIAQGVSRLTLLNRFPHMGLVIKQCLELHPIKYEKSDCVYIYGPTGSGKTTTCKRVLDWFKRACGVKYYAKMGGLSKFFDGYDWQEIILIDDPVTPDAAQ